MTVGEGHTPVPPTLGVIAVTTQRIRVLVVYSHQILGEGLERMLEAEDRIEVTAVSVDAEALLETALAGDPDVIVLEEGGPLHAADILSRTKAPVIIDVDIASADAWTYRRDPIRSGPDELLDAVLAGDRTAVRARTGHGGAHAHAPRPRMRAAAIPS
jgi:chemotaxis response regulator CheB